MYFKYFFLFVMFYFISAFVTKTHKLQKCEPFMSLFFPGFNLFYLSGLTLTSSVSIYLVLFWLIYTCEMNQCRTRQTVACLQSLCSILIQHYMQFSLRKSMYN